MPSRMCLTLKRPQLVYQWISSAMTTQTMLGNGTYLCMPRLAAQDHKTRPVVTDALVDLLFAVAFQIRSSFGGLRFSFPYQ